LERSYPRSTQLKTAAQIDITIRRNGKLIFVECRHHKRRQGVTWIEELIGRRESLGAHATIAVSSSGFTKGALKKAKAFEILTRDLRFLTAIEVTNWGRPITLTIYFYQYSDLHASLCFNRRSIPLVSQMSASELGSHPGLQLLFNASAQYFGSENLMQEQRLGQPHRFQLRLQPSGFDVFGEPVVEVDFKGVVRLISKEIISPAVFAYEESQNASAGREATIQDFDLGRTSIVQAAHRISVFLDISKLGMPPFCQFRFFRLVGQEEVDHESIELLGLSKLWVRGRMNVRISSMSG
jgi:Restriction endonuclease